MQLSWACEEQLFRQEMENADDVRLSVRLFSKCLPDKKKVRFCVCDKTVSVIRHRVSCLCLQHGDPPGHCHARQHMQPRAL